MSDIIPVLNGGSSSLKFSIFEIADEQSLALRITGQIEGLGRSPRFVAKNETGDLLEERHWENAGSIDVDFLFGFLVGWATGQISGSTVRGVGHRVVHGGLEYDAPVAAMSTCTAAFTVQPELHQDRADHEPANPAGRVLRHGFSPGSPENGRPVRAAARLLRRRNPALRISWFVV
jgi:hypothetical protein